MSFNSLSEAQAERLAIISEELGEVAQMVGKILRHGYKSAHPYRPDVSNRELLEIELGDLAAAINLAIDAGDINEDNVTKEMHHRLKIIHKYTHHQEQSE